MPTARRKGPHIPTTAEHHAEWLGLLRPEGPFLGIHTLTAAFPQGLDTVQNELRRRVRQAWAELSEAPDLLGPAWQDLIITELLRYPAGALTDGAALTGFSGLRPDAVAYGPDPAGGRAARLHLYRRPPTEPLIEAVRGEPALVERVAALCRDTHVPLALLTNGRLWVLVHSRPGGAPAVAVFDADLWLEEPLLLRAFATLVSSSRVLPSPADAKGEPSTSLAGLFARSADERAELPKTLGGQVRQAVELLVAELARLDRESGGRLLADVSERDIYRAGLTVLMRLVFLLYAEEQRLLPVTDPVYAAGYAVSTVYERLEEERTLHGDEVGDRRTAAWPRLLALFGAIHGGCEHPDLRIPAYGGSLLDPAPFWWLPDAAVTDRVVREMLDALLMLKHKGGKAPERLSYVGLDVEQIGHVYEGLLEFSCRKVTEPFVGLIGKAEPELPLAELESAALAGDFRASLITRCGLTVHQLDKALAAAPSLEQAADLHAACDNDGALADRVRPFWGLLRKDLRGLPTVFPAGSVLFTQVEDRRATGTHYTPRVLAEEVVEHTLAPLCFAPGPADGAERGIWRSKKADELLELKVVDPAMGSGAFLVSACRYLAERVVEAWDRDGLPDDVADLLGSGDDRDGLLLAARRKVASRCLYGVDRDDMAVELAKLSLWLVTLAKGKPFGFLDHALRCGDSLVGLISEAQVAALHFNPKVSGEHASNLFRYLHEQVAMVLSDVTDLRHEIEATVVQDARDAAEKADKLATANWMTRKLRLAADAVVGAALSTAVRHTPWYAEEDNDEDFEDRINKIGDNLYHSLRDDSGSPVERELRARVDTWLRGNRGAPIRPLHWPLEFPEVMRRGGFNAVVGNPPFIGGLRLTGAVGGDVREYLKTYVARDKPGSADLCSYFLLRDVDIVWHGRVGIIATNTIAQGDTREVGLDQVVASGISIYRAEKSQPWPGTASLEVSLVWVGHVDDGEPRFVDGRPVKAIMPSLDPRSRSSGNPHRLAAYSEQSFIGSYVLGMGFIMTPEDAQSLVARNPRNREVLFPYLNGEDLNSSPSQAASRWVINFRDWPIENARTYTDCFAIVEAKVMPERANNNNKQRREIWWRFTRPTVELYEAIADLDRVIVIAVVSRLVMPAFVHTGQVLSHKLCVFGTDLPAELCILSSNMHTSWAWRYSSTMKADLNYSPSDVFETFPQPVLTQRMDRVGEELDSFRRGVMLGRNLGLTKLYNLVHNPAVTDEDVRRLREIHVEVDRATAEGYGWGELELGHGFHETRQGRRFTIAPDVQVEVLDRLLELNHQRYAEEVAQGLHVKGKGKLRRARKAVAEQPAMF